MIDLFCGNGNFSLPLAAKGIKVEGRDLSESAIACAQKSVSEHSLPASYLKENIYTVTQSCHGKDLLIIDPLVRVLPVSVSTTYPGMSFTFPVTH